VRENTKQLIYQNMTDVHCWEELKLQFLFAFRQVKTHSKILPVESLFIIVFFFVILQTDRYNIHSQLEHCKYEVSLIPAFRIHSTTWLYRPEYCALFLFFTFITDISLRQSIEGSGNETQGY